MEFMEKHGNQFRFKFKRNYWWDDGHRFNYNDNMHVKFFKSPFGPWLNVKICHPHKHSFLQILFMHVYMRWFDPESDCGQSCHVQQITMQICIAWIFHASICNSIKGAIPIENLCFKHNIYTPNPNHPL
jgi:hypothetical protein